MQDGTLHTITCKLGKYKVLTQDTAWHSSNTSQRIVQSALLLILQTQAKAPAV